MTVVEVPAGNDKVYRDQTIGIGVWATHRRMMRQEVTDWFNDAIKGGVSIDGVTGLNIHGIAALSHAVLKFEDPRDAMLFKLTWL